MEHTPNLTEDWSFRSDDAAPETRRMRWIATTIWALICAAGGISLCLLSLVMMAAFSGDQGALFFGYLIIIPAAMVGVIAVTVSLGALPAGWQAGDRRGALVRLAAASFALCVTAGLTVWLGSIPCTLCMLMVGY